MPVGLLAAGHSVINTDQALLLDRKTSDTGQLSQTLDETSLWAGAPGRRSWSPYVFSVTGTAYLALLRDSSLVAQTVETPSTRTLA
jgi:hypothetical protein